MGFRYPRRDQNRGSPLDAATANRKMARRLTAAKGTATIGNTNNLKFPLPEPVGRAIAAGGVPYLQLQEQTGIERSSI
jgi:hypothetical protein